MRIFYRSHIPIDFIASTRHFAFGLGSNSDLTGKVLINVSNPSLPKPAQISNQRRFRGWSESTV